MWSESITVAKADTWNTILSIHCRYRSQMLYFWHHTCANEATGSGSRIRLGILHGLNYKR
ncbi:hypothetical protein TYRP_021323 [Tyrophagus putrescentiae]|nr:hypothetical protein TYRP_021323 [Tyrophagus putrescentiae]